MLKQDIPQRIELLISPSTEQIIAHVLPCHINYSGPAPVEEFFTSTIRQGEAYFRGRKLLGNGTVLPENYIGTIVDSSKPSETVQSRPHRPDEEEEEDGELEELSQWTAKAQFKTLVQYQHAETFTESPAALLTEWIALAKVLHE